MKTFVEELFATVVAWTISTPSSHCPCHILDKTITTQLIVQKNSKLSCLFNSCFYN